LFPSNYFQLKEKKKKKDSTNVNDLAVDATLVMGDASIVINIDIFIDIFIDINIITNIVEAIMMNIVVGVVIDTDVPISNVETFKDL
jgi:hypothetical protein